MAEGDLEHLGRFPSWHQYAIGVESLLVAASEVDDPEETLMVQMTVSEVAMVSLGIILLERMFPETTKLAEGFGHKIQEIAKVQQYFEGNEDEEL